MILGWCVILKYFKKFSFMSYNGFICVISVTDLLYTQV